MEVAVRQGPAFGVARLTLGPNEPVRVESGAMMSMSSGVMLQSKAEGGIMKSLKRAALGGESFFVSTYTAPAQGGFVDVAARLPGDVSFLSLQPGRGLFISRGCWLANETTITVDSKWGGFGNLFGGEGGFILRADGTGEVVFACYGALEVWNLQAGQSFIVDSGHMVAYDEGVTMTVRKASEAGIIQSFKSGENMVFEFTGPGRVWTQTRNPAELQSWIMTFAGNSAGGGGGIVGGLMGRG
jgi:uncharacterized protein (TIGR00266 family)